MKLFIYIGLTLLTLIVCVPQAQAQTLAARTAEVGSWTDLPVGASAAFERSREPRRAEHAPEPIPSDLLVRSRAYPLLHTVREAGTASDYFLVSPERSSGNPVWVKDLFSLRESVQRSTTYQGPGVWMGLDPMNLKATLKLEIEKVINVID